MEFNKEKEVSYWDSFYSNSDQKNLIPSQFAVFAISEMNDHSITFVVECGAGNGRDSFFFCSHWKTVLSLDRSSQAVENISKTADFIGMERSALHRKLKSLGIKGIN